jgi:hypothetical protein
MNPVPPKRRAALRVNNLANEGHRRANQEARDKQLDAVAAVEEPEITAFILERARRKYFQQFQVITLVRNGEARHELSIDGRAAEVRRMVEQAEPDRLEYEHLRSLWDSQERTKAARSTDALARSNTRYALVVAFAVVVQTVIAFVALFRK